MSCFYSLAFLLNLDFKMFTTRSIMEIICYCPDEKPEVLGGNKMLTKIQGQQALGKSSLNVTSLFLKTMISLIAKIWKYQIWEATIKEKRGK